MHNKPRCICGKGFGLVSQYHWRMRFCSRKCKQDFLHKQHKERERAKRFLSWLHGQT